MVMRIAAVGVFLFGATAFSFAQTTTFVVDPQQSTFTVDVGRAGFLKVFGHDHRIEVREFSGSVDWNQASPEASRFALEVASGSLTVADEELKEDDRQSVQANMETEALSVSQYPSIVFESSRVEVDEADGDSVELTVVGTLALRGVSRELELPVRVVVDGERLVASGRAELESDEWGVPQISAAGGSVKTKKELGLTYEIVAVAEN